ncbi:twin-arginine translocase TatA/TatE family subunit [Pullulanibacillus sp. KACC 23026]|uniref:twin-arginine translocase TatA/TatE family subunit n=1 Tax=Pullulanibacillus sp. KACC 23026 TaxID=3028315 RepID=UPI0023AE918E|nr:twin-arginine translocase TatA/TatE family subunit [Pullulanibacillus sp. KACC 23026]WEG13716.1 twin-arginine translocase TatA/TatE family subunit [Pullulanibacillus sp. KACC 23026]
MGLGPTSIILIVIVAFIIFGPKKLPEFGKSIGMTLREFKKTTSGLLDEKEEAEITSKKQENDS